MADATLLPCPFCGFAGSDYVGLAHVETYGKNEHRIRCGQCRACSGSHPTHEAAIEAWNTRQPQLPSDDGLIKALGNALDLIDELYRKYEVELDDDDILVAQSARNTFEALSRHKAPLSVAGDDVERALQAITDVRHRAAASFEEGFTGARGQAYDRAVLDCYDAVRALIALQVTEGDELEKRPDGFVGMHFDECDYFTSRGSKPCSLDCCS